MMPTVRVFAAVAWLLFLSLAARSQERNGLYLAAEQLVNSTQKENFKNVRDAAIEMQSNKFPAEQRPAFRTAMTEFMEKYYTWDTVKEAYIRIYMAQFTESELKEISAFYKTPAGAKLMNRTPDIVALSGTTGQQIMMSHQKEFMEIMKKHLATVK